MSERSLDECLWWMRSIAGKGASAWERSVAKSMMRHARRPAWKPTEKQTRTMRRLIDEYLAAGEDVQLIEED